MTVKKSQMSVKLHVKKKIFDKQVMQSLDNSQSERPANLKKKTVMKRQARLYDVPRDIMNQINSKKGGFSPGSAHSPHLSPASVPISYASSPQANSSSNSDGSNQTFIFNCYIDAPTQYNSNTIIINDVPRDINEVISEIILTRPPAPQFPKTDIYYICPFSNVPLTCPGRGVHCSHYNCFDLREFILAQIDDEWRCPICNMPITYNELRFDPQYFKQMGAHDYYSLLHNENQVEPWAEFRPE